MCQRKYSDQVLYLSSNFKRSVQLSIVQIGLTVFLAKNAVLGWLNLQILHFSRGYKFLSTLGKMFTDGTEISRHFFSTFKKLGTVFANLGK